MIELRSSFRSLAPGSSNGRTKDSESFNRGSIHVRNHKNTSAPALVFLWFRTLNESHRFDDASEREERMWAQECETTVFCWFRYSREHRRSRVSAATSGRSPTKTRIHVPEPSSTRSGRPEQGTGPAKPPSRKTRGFCVYFHSQPRPVRAGAAVQEREA